MSLNVHPFHIVDQSPWPIVAGRGALVLTSGLLRIIHTGSYQLLRLGLIIIILSIFQWWRDVVREGAYQGLHTSIVVLGLRGGIILFIVSEVLFFLSFFWAYFHSSLAPTLELGGVWPPVGVEIFNPFQIPLLNSAILLGSGVTVTWAHHALLESNYTQAGVGLGFTILLGVYFTFFYKDLSI